MRLWIVSFEFCLAKVEVENPRLGASWNLRCWYFGISCWSKYIYIYMIYVALYMYICSVKVMSGWWNISDEIFRSLIVVGSMWMWSESRISMMILSMSFPRSVTDLRHKAPLLLCPKTEVQVGLLLNCVVVARADSADSLRNSRNQYGYIAMRGCCTCWYMLYVFASICITFLIPIWNMLNDKQ